MNLDQMTIDVYNINKTNGWFDLGRTLDDDVALLHSEVSEMFEAFRSWGLEDQTGNQCSTNGDGIHLHGEKPCKPEGVGSEAADILIRLLDTCLRRDCTASKLESSLELGEAIEMKSFSYWTNQLHKAIDWCNGLGHVQAGLNITFQVLIYGCNQYDINLEAEYERKLAYNKTRGYRHGGKLL